MLAAFVAGIAFAVGHHFFYHSLQSKRVDGATFNQQINTGIGTAFAFLVRACLVIAVGVAFVQVFWQQILRKAVTVERIDSMSQLQQSLFDLFNFRTVRQHPLLALLATISWTLPFAVIVPPATLVIQQSIEPVSIISGQNLPHINFAQSSLFSDDFVTTKDPKYDAAQNTIVPHWFRGATNSLQQLSAITAFRAQIPQSQAPSPNSSYTHSFYGPALQCLPTSNDVMKDFEAVFDCDFYLQDRTGNKSCSFKYSYLSWTPIFNQRVPFTNSSRNPLLSFTNTNSGSKYDHMTIGAMTNQSAMIYVASYLDRWSVLNCTFFNASYTADFEHVNSTQRIKTSRELLNGIGFEPQISSEINAPINGWPPMGTVIEYASQEQISYFGVMEALGRIMVGGIFVPITSRGGGVNILSTTVQSTKIASALSGNDSKISIARMTEELFQNITLMLYSVPSFTSINSSKFPATDVTLFLYPNIYNYTWRRLVLAYGLAILFAAIAVVIGGYVFLQTGESYSYTFSTILRTTRDKNCDELVSPDATRGQDPLPESIAKAHVRVGAMSNGEAHGIETVRFEQYQRVKRPVTTIYTAVRSVAHDDEGASEPRIQHFTIPRKPLNRGRAQEQAGTQSRQSISPVSFDERQATSP